MKDRKIKIFAEIMESLYTYERIIEKYNSTPRHYGIDEDLYMTEVHVLKIIGDNPGLSLREIADMTFRTRPAMSMLIKSLSEKDLVVRKRSPEDNRRYIITLTDKGNVVYNYHEKLDEKSYTEILDTISEEMLVSEEELVQTLGLLKQINRVSNSRIN